MMYCENCGKQLSEDEAFCTGCGTAANTVQATEIAVKAPVAETPVKEKPKTRDCRVKMLVMTFLTFMFVIIFPIFTYSNNFLTVDLYAMDVGRISSVGKEITSLHEGELVTSIEEMTEENVAESETPEEKEIAKKIQTKAVDFTKEIEPKLIKWLEPLNLAFTLLFIAAAFVLFGFIISLIAGAKNMKKTYLITNIVILIILITVSAVVASKTSLGTSVLGDGMWMGILMTILSCIIPFVKKKKKEKKTA